MSTITVSLPDEDLAFLTAYCKSHGTTPEAFFVDEIRTLRENIEKRPILPMGKGSAESVSQVDEEALRRLWRNGRIAWKNIPSASAWVDGLRGNM